jgi:hypothetical protein
MASYDGSNIAEAMEALHNRVCDAHGMVAGVDLLQAKLLPKMNQLQLLLRDRNGGRMYTAVLPLLRVEDGDQTARIRKEGQ